MRKLQLYSAKWCTACAGVKNIIEGLESIEVELIDVEQQTEKAISLGIRNIPVLRLVENEEEIGRLVGNKSKTEIEELIKRVN